MYICIYTYIYIFCVYATYIHTYIHTDEKAIAPKQEIGAIRAIWNIFV